MTTLTTKSIKDYLHFYLGAQVTIKNVSAYLIGQGYEDGRYFLGADLLHHILLGNCDIETIELRNLSDMTVGEEIEIFQVGESDWRQRHLEFKADQFTKLLSKGFDLFNLIPEGLAIDKQTLKQ